MNKPTKGALAAGAAVLLLLGGGGSLAVWTESQSVTGTNLDTGELDLLDADCGEWLLETGVNTTQALLAGDLLVPGDVLTKVCTFTIQATGENLEATVSVTNPTFSGTGGDLNGNLNASVSGLTVGGSPATSFTDADDGEELSVTLQVTFDELAGNLTQDQMSVLDDLTVTATQVVS